MSTLLSALFGGALIGLSAGLLLLLEGRIAGISGIAGRLATSHDRGWRLAFLGGLFFGGLLFVWRAPQAFGAAHWASLPVLAVAGALVGVGTQIANGCTSGHGVCGIGRGSKRSLVATITFMTVAALVVAAMRGLS